MYKAVIAGYSRSPFTMARKGGLIDIKPVNLLAEVIKDLVSKSKINQNDIEDVVADKINKPDSIIIGKFISEKTATYLFITLNLFGVIFGYLLSLSIEKSSFFMIFVMELLLR